MSNAYVIIPLLEKYGIQDVFKKIQKYVYILSDHGFIMGRLKYVVSYYNDFIKHQDIKETWNLYDKNILSNNAFIIRNNKFVNPIIGKGGVVINGGIMRYIDKYIITKYEYDLFIKYN